MRTVSLLLLGASLLAGSAHAASDKPIIGPAPDWVVPSTLPATDDKPGDAPVTILLSDQQVKMEAGRQTVYSDVALRIQTPQGLAAGNMSLPWNPETDQLSVHKLLIHRGAETIDVLGSGQTFTVIRREPNLDNAMLDGVLTANIQSEGLQVGDVLELAVSVSSSDPVLKGHAEQFGALWNEAQIGRAHFKAQWPSQMAIAIRQSSALPPIKVSKSESTSSIELTLDKVEPVIPPKYAPGRYRAGRFVELSDFRSWAELGALMAPLYIQASTIPASGPLRVELEKIKASSTDPINRSEAALALVQDRVRYVALLMGAGGYVPAKAEETWSRRFGDCKGKTALLLGLLWELGISAEPVAANIGGGDGFDQRLPMIGLFNHVLVRATIAGKTYWLDGTRTGDTSLARLRTPAFGWGLPLVASGAQLVEMRPAALDTPDDDLAITIDARKGLFVPAPFKAVSVLRGDTAVATKLSLANMTADSRDRTLRDYWKGRFDFVDISAVGSSFDTATGEQKLTVEGMARMSWKDGWYEADQVGLGYKADFERPAGPDKDAPYLVFYPNYSHVSETILLPPGFHEGQDLANARVEETIAGVEYHRRADLIDNVFRIEASSRSVIPEFPAKDATGAQQKLRDLADNGVYLKRPNLYQLTEEEVNAPLPEGAGKEDMLLLRGVTLLNTGQYDKAIKDFDDLIVLDPKNSYALANRGITKAWTHDTAGAAKDLDAAVAIDPKNGVAARGRGLLEEEKGDDKAAITAYGDAIALDKSDGFSFERRALVQARNGNDEAALSDSAQAIDLKAGSSNLRLMRANIFKRQGKPDLALAEAKAMIAASHEDIWAFITAARIMAINDHRDEAMATFDRALAIKEDPYIYVNRAGSRPKNDVAGREADYDSALKLEPDMHEALAGKANILIDKGRSAEAVTLYSAALDKSPKDRSLLTGRGYALARDGDKAKAEKDFAAVRQGTTDGMDFNNLCWSMATLDVALETALKDCDRGLEKLPGNPAILDSRAFVLLRLGRLDDAIADYDAALTKAPKLPSSHYGRAIAWARKGDKAKAEADRIAAIAVSPDVADQFAQYGVPFPAGQ